MLKQLQIKKMNNSGKTFLYSNLAESIQSIATTYEIKLNLIFISLLKYIPIGFASIWYNDSKTPNYVGLIAALLWYSLANQLMKCWKQHHYISLNEYYYQQLLQVFTRLAIVRFISQTFEIHSSHETLLVIFFALAGYVLQFIVQKQSMKKNKVLKMVQNQWVIFMQIFILLHLVCVKQHISFPFTAPIMEIFLLLHFIWLMYLVFLIAVNIKCRWQNIQIKKWQAKMFIIIAVLIYGPLTIYIAQTHLYSGIGIRYYMEAVSTMIVANVLSKKRIQLLAKSIKLKVFNINCVIYTLVMVGFLTVYVYQRKQGYYWEAVNLYNIMTMNTVFALFYTFWQSFIINKRLVIYQSKQ